MADLVVELEDVKAEAISKNLSRAASRSADKNVLGATINLDIPRGCHRDPVPLAERSAAPGSYTASAHDISR